MNDPVSNTPAHHPVLNARYIVLSLLSSLTLIAGLIGQFAPASVAEGIFGAHAARVQANGWVLVGLGVIIAVYNVVTTYSRKRAALRRRNALSG